MPALSDDRSQCLWPLPRRGSLSGNADAAFETGRDLERALSRSVDRAAPRATGQRESLAALLDRRGGKRWRDQYQRDERSAQGKSQHCGPTFPSCRKGTNLESATTSIKRFALTGKV
jgi:hypothetical protein